MSAISMTMPLRSRSTP